MYLSANFFDNNKQNFYFEMVKTVFSDASTIVVKQLVWSPVVFQTEEVGFDKSQLMKDAFALHYGSYRINSFRELTRH